MLNRTGINLITSEFLDRIKKAHPPMKIYPGIDKEKLMFNAGEQSIIEWIEAEMARQS